MQISNDRKDVCVVWMSVWSDHVFRKAMKEVMETSQFDFHTRQNIIKIQKL